MSENQLKNLDASKLRIILATSIILLIGVSVALFVFFRGQLVSYAEQVRTANTEASVSQSDITMLENLQKELDENSVAVNRTKNIVADSQKYQYQNQIIEDITTYAQKANVGISGYAFTTDSAASTGAAAGASSAATPTPSGLKSVGVSINIKSPVNYQSIIRFIHYIESNLTKMQVSGVSLSGDGSSDVTASPITIQVYTR